MRAVLDVNVLVSALIARDGSPARVLRGWVEGRFELVVSPLLLAELEATVTYPKLRKRITPAEASELTNLLRRTAKTIDDRDEPPPVRPADSADDYLIALAASAQAVIVSGDRHLLALRERIPVYSPREFLDLIGEA